MDNKFIWVPFFKELAKKLLDYGDNHRMLIQVLKKCGISDGMDDVDVGDKKIELDDIDPFTFFSFIMKYGEEKRIHYLEKIKQELSIQSELPKDFSGVPSTFAVKVWLFSFKKNRGEADIANLWKLFNQALSSALDTDLFKQVLKIHGVGKPKLTQSLFIASPDNYFPIDKQSIPYLKNRGINQSFDTLQEYLQIIDNIKNIIKKPLYEISHDAWFETTGPGKSPNGQGIKYWLYAPGREARYWDEYYKKGIIGIGPNEIGDFRQFSSKKEIYKRLQEINKSDLSPTNDSLASWEFLDVMKPGDIIIVKKGRRHYLGYGIVAGDYEYDISRTDYHQIRKVAWKKEGVWEEKGTPIVVKSLTDITKYPDYVKKLKKLIGIPEHQKTSEKNIILYGPPGTGKTYQTINYACAIIENNTIQEINQEESGVENGRKIILDRFHEYVKREQIQFITFHQSFSYEDFIESEIPTPKASQSWDSPPT